MNHLDIVVNQIIQFIIMSIVLCILRWLWKIERNNQQQHRRIILLIYIILLMFGIVSPIIMSLIFGFMGINLSFMIPIIILAILLTAIITFKTDKVADSLFPSTFMLEAVIFTEKSRPSGVKFVRFTLLLGHTLVFLTFFGNIIYLILEG